MRWGFKCCKFFQELIRNAYFLCAYILILQEQELLVRLSDLQAELCSRSNRITDLDHEIHSLNETIDTLTRELELKGKEVLRVRSEANHQIRYRTQRR